MAAFMASRRAGLLLRHFARTPAKQTLWLGQDGLLGGHVTSCLCVSLERNFGSTQRHGCPGSSKPTVITGSAITPQMEVLPEEQEFRERFIPITRRSIVRYIMQEKNFLNEDERRNFEKFSLSLDSAIVNQYHGMLQELKSLFDPINPDKDTIAARQLNRREKLDNEFWLLQKLAVVMEKANFHELSRATIETALAEHSADEGVLVSVNPDKYDVLRFWALGKERPTVNTPWYKKLVNRVLRNPNPQPIEYYKRVVVGVRLKTDDKLLLKAFKEVPVNALEQLLPDGKIVMSNFDKSIMMTTVSLAFAGVIAKIVTMLAHITVDWVVVITGVFGLVGVQSWTSYKNRRNAYLVELSRMLYFKNVANNRGLLTLLVDRAEDELLKEALMVYSFLLVNRPPSAQIKPSNELLPAELGGIPEAQLEKQVEDWLHQKTGTRIEFESAGAVKLLQEFGILFHDNDNLHVLPLDSAMRNLPQQPQSITARVEEYDIVEGYDRDVYDETEEEYRGEKEKRRRFGWF